MSYMGVILGASCFVCSKSSFLTSCQLCLLTFPLHIAKITKYSLICAYCAELMAERAFPAEGLVFTVIVNHLFLSSGRCTVLFQISVSNFKVTLLA